MTTAKQSELSNTHTMPGSIALPIPADKAVIKKAQQPRLPGEEHNFAPPDGNAGGVPGKTPERLPQSHVLHPHVNVSGDNPPRRVQEKKASRFALKDRYPLDSYADVKTAAAYFDEFQKRMPPEDRREYCVNLVKRASELGIAVSDDARKYGAETYAPEEEIKVAFDIRRSLLEDVRLRSGLDKLATCQEQLEPEFFALALAEFDKVAGLNYLYDADVPDPFYSTFGIKKTASFSETIGNTYVTGADLEYLAMKRLPLIQSTFSHEVVSEFRKDPIGVYKSLPLTQRRVLANMAREQNAGSPGSG